jgi:hypothetical protein
MVPTVFPIKPETHIDGTSGTEVQGYLHPRYAASLTEFGKPRLLRNAIGWVLEREIPGTQQRDAMGSYPLFVCGDWTRLGDDLKELDDDLISLTIVTDPLGDFSVQQLQSWFSDRVTPFKEHFIIDLDAKQTVSRHHRYYAQRALAAVEVDVFTDGPAFLDDWIKLYANLSSRHDLTGINAFSRSSFAKQLSVPGLVIFRAQQQRETVGAHLWYVQGETAYSHLAAVSQRGYDLMASYALYAYALDYFGRHARIMHLGAGAGLHNDQADGLARFKRGWANGTRTAYLCGKIFNHKKYHELVTSSACAAGNYFPAYRMNEFR